MAIVLDTTLNVIDKYKTLVLSSLDGDSVYARVKETLERLENDGAISEAKKAELMASVVTSVVGSITSNSMSTALAWDAKEKELQLQKLELEAKLTNIQQDTLIKEAQVRNLNTDRTKTQAEIIRLYGKPVLDIDGNVAALTDEGKVFTDIQYTVAQTSKVAKEQLAIDSNIKQTEANTYKIMADALVNHGSWTYTVSNTGVASASRTAITGFTPLSDLQATIAKEQAKGYTYNAWSNVVTTASSMIGTAIASDMPIFAPGDVGRDMIDKIILLTDKITAVNPPIV